jgi:hypothetical protein
MRAWKLEVRLDFLAWGFGLVTLFFIIVIVGLHERGPMIPFALMTCASSIAASLIPKRKHALQVFFLGIGILTVAFLILVGEMSIISFFYAIPFLSALIACPIAVLSYRPRETSPRPQARGFPVIQKQESEP